MGIILCALTAATVLIVNVLLTLTASIKYDLHAGFGTLLDGSCQTTRNLNLWLHLAINVLSTLLLGASNYCMQCLASPTREEIDKAHEQQVWLDIGIPSVRNLSRIAPSRRVLWCLLAASTVPLHLLWNGAIFTTLTSHDYYVFVASPDLISIDRFNRSASVPGTCAPDPYLENNNNTLQNYRDWERLDNDACIQTYAQDYVSAHGDVIAITSNMNSSVPILCFAHSAEYIQSYIGCAPITRLQELIKQILATSLQTRRTLQIGHFWTRIRIQSMTFSTASVSPLKNTASSNLA